MEEFDLNNTFWERIIGYVTELRVDARWILRDNNTKKSVGSLRIVSHPDLNPGYLRAIFTYVTSIKPKTDSEIMQSIEDYQMDITELEVYSVADEVNTETKTYEAPYKELEELFDVDIFE